MDTDDRVLLFIQRHHWANWYAIRHLEVEPYGTGVEALKALAANGLIEQDPQRSAGTYRLTPAGAIQIQARQERLAARLSILEDPALDVSTAHDLILELGDEQYRDALPVIKGFLFHPDHPLHTAALRVLVGQWYCGDQAYLLVAKRLITTDPYPACRRIGVTYLAWGSLFHKSATQDSLATLARLAHDPKEEDDLRLAAYHGMRTILKGMPIRELARLRDVTSLDDIDWTAVDFFLVEE